MESKERRHFLGAFKREVMDRAHTSGLTIIEVADGLGLLRVPGCSVNSRRPRWSAIS